MITQRPNYSLRKIDTVRSDTSQTLNAKPIESKYKETIEVINAVGSQWPFLLTIFFIMVFIIRWKWIWSKLDTTSKVKLGGQELEFNENKKTTVTSDDKVSSPMETSTPEMKETEVETEEKDFFKIFTLLKKGKSFEAEEIFEKFQKEAENDSERQLDKLKYHYYRYLCAYPSSLEDLIMSKDSLDSSNKSVMAEYYSLIGLCYLRGEVFESASENFIKSLEFNFDILVVSKNWESIYMSGKKDKAFSYIVDEIEKAIQNSIKASLYNLLAIHFEKESDFRQRSLALEKAIEFDPNNTNYLFSAAYGYSESNLDQLSLSHYLKRNSFEEDAVTLNNLGVAFSRFGLLGNSVKSYKRSVELNETLAASNLAYLLIEKGFYKEAESYIQAASQATDIHKNVWSAKDHLENQKKEEAEKLEKLRVESTAQHQYIRDFGSKFFKSNPQKIKIDGSWRTESGTPIQIDTYADFVNFTWKDAMSHRISFKPIGLAGYATYKVEKEGSYFSGDNKNYEIGFFKFDNNTTISLFFYLKDSHKFLRLLC